MIEVLVFSDSEPAVFLAVLHKLVIMISYIREIYSFRGTYRCNRSFDKYTSVPCFKGLRSQLQFLPTETLSLFFTGEHSFNC